MTYCVLEEGGGIHSRLWVGPRQVYIGVSCVAKTCAVHPVFARSRSQNFLKGAMRQMHVRGRNLRLLEKLRSRGTRSTRDQKTRTVGTWWIFSRRQKTRFVADMSIGSVEGDKVERSLFGSSSLPGCRLLYKNGSRIGHSEAFLPIDFSRCVLFSNCLHCQIFAMKILLYL